MTSFQKLFPVKKPIIGMVHLQALPGEPGWSNINAVRKQALSDIELLQQAGLDGLLFENWQHASTKPFVADETLAGFAQVLEACAPMCRVPFGVNVLNNDYRAAFSLASRFDARFIQMDVLVDHVTSDFSYNQEAMAHPFSINVDVQDVQYWRNKVAARSVAVLASIQPKHYITHPRNKKMITSLLQAISCGVDGVVITKETGSAPQLEKVFEAQKGARGKVAVGMGSGLNLENIASFLPVIDFAIVGSALKVNGDVNNPVDLMAATRLMQTARALDTV